jgi:hypothetical protein
MNIENKTVIKFDDGREICLTEIEARQLMNKLNFIFNKNHYYLNTPWDATSKTYTTDSAKDYKPVTISSFNNSVDERITSPYVITDGVFQGDI